MDPRWRHKNHPGEFAVGNYEVPTFDEDRDGEALKAVREFIERYGTMPDQRSWAAARMSPAEKTIRNRFGSFKNAIAALTRG